MAPHKSQPIPIAILIQNYEEMTMGQLPTGTRSIDFH